MTNKAGASGQEEELRFGFGENWARYLELVDDDRIAAAEQSLRKMLGRDNLAGEQFLDVGSGSGLFSLAARNLGATVYSFDFDPESVECTKALRHRFRPDDSGWHIERGDALDQYYLDQLGHFDVVYSWGVLHHTGEMWRALANVARLVKCDGQLFVAIYNDQRWLSRYWTRVKQLYNKGFPGRVLVIATHAPYFLLRQFAKALLRPIKSSGIRRRGMDPWRDFIDWVGGYPFEVARPEELLAFYRERGFSLERMTTVDGRHGCNEYIFRKPADSD
jgi:2-polyprenyl-6-hydroxyphenyl methylase/3-demethylubiquinone-9 3-methyltransferase